MAAGCSSCGAALPPGDGATEPRRCAACLEASFGAATTSVSVYTRAGGGPASACTVIPMTRELAERYQLGAELGAGGMGVVYRALRRADGRAVALKFLVPQAGAEVTERFLREGRVMSAIAHPHVVQVLEVGILAGHPYLACELLAGGTLSSLLAREKTLPIARAVGLVVDVLEGLQAAHELGVVHRDVKPANVLLDAAGRAKVADFGVAKHYGERDVHLTATGQIIGTAAYMAPEQLVGESAGIAVDLFAAGAILYESLAGARPYRGRNLVEIAVAHQTPPPRLSSLCAGLPAGVDRVVMSALARDPSARPQSARDVVVALRRAVPGLAPALVLAPPAPPPPAPAARRAAADPRPTVPALQAELPPGLRGRFRALDARTHNDGLLYEVEDCERGELVTLYLPSPAAEFEKYLRNEASVLRALSHRGVIHLVDHGVTDGRPWSTYHWPKGRTFKDEQASGLPGRARALHVAMDALDALAAVHAGGFVHHDVKPATIWCDHSGRALLTDFILARPVPRPGETGDGTIHGTPRYMSPEHATGACATPLSDLYSTGVVLYEALAGRPPFIGETLERLIANVVRQRTPPPSDFAEVPRDLEAVVMRAIARDPAERFPGALDMRRALSAFAPLRRTR